MRWKHSPVFTTKRQLVKVHCICGQQSPGWMTLESATAWYSTHTGLKEKPVKGARQ